MLEIKACSVIVAALSEGGVSGWIRFKLVCRYEAAPTTVVLIRRLRLDSRMIVLQRIKEWWRDFRDPVNREKRKQQKRSQKMAEFLDRNRLTEEKRAENDSS